MRILVMGHSAGQIGGVSNFLRLMKEKNTSDDSLELFVVGPRDGERGKTARLLRLASDYVAFGLKLFEYYDVIHMNPSLDRRSFVRTVVFMMMSIIARKKFMIFFRGWDWAAFEYYFSQDSFTAKFVRRVMRRSECFVVLAPAFKDSLQRLYPEHPIYVITTMFDGRLMPAEKQKVFNAPHLLFMSRFIPSKGGKQTIDAFVKLKAEFPGATLTLAGDGPSREEWESHAKSYGSDGEAVHFAGYVKGETKLHALQEANIFVMPTDHPEGMPNALMEAMGAGLIPVITSAGGTFDAIKYGELGYMLDSASATLVVDAVRKIMADTQRSMEMSAAIRSHAWNNFEATIIINKLLDIYKKTANMS